MKRLIYIVLQVFYCLCITAQTHGTFKILSSQKFNESTFQYDVYGNIYSLSLCENGETVISKINTCGTLLWAKRIAAIHKEKVRLITSENLRFTFVGKNVYIVIEQIYLSTFRSNTREIIHCLTTGGELKWSRIFPIKSNKRLSPELNGFVDANGHLVLSYFKEVISGSSTDSLYFSVLRLNQQNGEIINQNSWSKNFVQGGFGLYDIPLINVYEINNEVELLTFTKDYKLEKTIIRLNDLSLVGHFSQTGFKRYIDFSKTQIRNENEYKLEKTIIRLNDLSLVGHFSQTGFKRYIDFSKTQIRNENEYKLDGHTEFNRNEKWLFEIYGRFDSVVTYKPFFNGTGDERCALNTTNDSIIWIKSIAEYPKAHLESCNKGDRFNQRYALDAYTPGEYGFGHKEDVFNTSIIYNQNKHLSKFKNNHWFDIIDYNSGYCSDTAESKWSFKVEDTIIVDWTREILKPGPKIFLKDTTFTIADSDFEIRKICGSNDWLPSKYLPNDTVVCDNSFELKADSVPSHAKVQWSTGDTVETIIINSSGYYFATVSNSSCQVTDSIHVQFIKNPLALKRNRFYKCEHDSFEIAVKDFEYFNLIEGDDTLVGNANLSAVWLTQQGDFKLETKPEYQCPKTFEFSLSNSIPTIELPTDTLLCDKMNLKLAVSNSYNSYLFLNGQISDSLKPQYALLSTTDSIVSILIVDSLGCTDADTMLLKEHEKLQIDYNYDSLFTCRSDSFKLSIKVETGKPSFFIVINDSSIVLDSNNYELQNAIGKVYQIAVKDDCNRRMAIPTVDTKAKRLNLQAHFSGADTLLLGSTFSSFASVDNGTLYWYLNEVAQHSNQRFTHLPADTGIFDLTIKGEYLNCSDSASKTYYVTTPFLYVPNAFTVNNDGLNEQWQPKCYKCKIKGYKIYNRWGQLIFESEGNTAWDGTLNGENVPAGVYQTLISYTDETGALHTKSVAIYLLK
ncbi:MAG: gliding motility-associated C-terminal domain-containing protein [Bacteroidia bacterium]